MDPLVSVVTVTYNSGNFVRDAIDSVLAQSYRNFEFIIGDDCSKDDTWEIISGYSDSRIIRYRNNENMGEYPNRNKAIGMASGKYLIFVDGDDVLLTYGLEFYVRNAEKFPEAGMVIQREYTNNVIYPALFSPRQILENHYFGKFDLLTSSFSSNFFRLDILKEMGMLSTRYRGGDNHIRVKIAAHYPVLFVQGYVSWPRETPGSASSKLTPALLLIETYTYTAEFKSIYSLIDESLVNDIIKQMEIRVSRFIFNRIKRGRISDIRFVTNATGIGPVEALKHLTQDIDRKDFLMRYSAVDPFKRDYLR